MSSTLSPAIDTLSVRTLSADELSADLPAFGDLLHACVHGGASVSFVLPFSQAEAEAFWRRKVLPGIAAGHVVLLAAYEGGRLLGTVQMDHDTPANQPHRADVRKLLVHPQARRRGIARRLMTEIEAAATRLGRKLLTLDTRTGDGAEPLYNALGYERVGVIPGYSVDPLDPTRLDGTTIMYRRIG